MSSLGGTFVIEVLDRLHDLASQRGEASLRTVAGACIARIEHRPATSAEAELLRVPLRDEIGLLLESLAGQGSRLDSFDEGMHVTDVLAGQRLNHLYPAVVEDWTAGAMERRSSLTVRMDRAPYERAWLPDGGDVPFIVEWLGLALWERLRVELEVSRPAVAVGVLERIRPVLWSKRRAVAERDGKRLIVSARGFALAELRETEQAPVLPVDIAAMLRATSSLAGHRLLRWLVVTGHHQLTRGVHADFRRIRVPGGFTGLANVLQCGGRKSVTEVRHTLELLQHAHLELPKREVGGLLTWTFVPEAHGRQAELRIVLGDPLLPNYVHELPAGGLAQRDARRLVPIPVRLPPLVGSPRYHAALAHLQILVIREMRHGAVQLPCYGGVLIPESRLAELAVEAEVPAKMLDAVRARWISLEEDAVLRPTASPDRYVLGPTYGPEQLFLEAAARNSQRAQQRRARSRRARKS